MIRDLVTPPLQVNSCPDFPIVQYADDTLVIMQASARQLVCLKALLNTFTSAIGLKVNYGKSIMVPINIAEDRVDIFTSTLQCARGQFPFTYLGLPLGIYKPTVEQCLPIVNRIAKRIAGIATFMTQAGKVLLVKSMLASLTVYFMCCLDIPITIKHQIIKYLRHCLWRSPDMEDRRPALVAWKTVCRPKNQGGLGVMDIFTQNKTLLMKNLHNFYNRHDIPWVQLIWDTYYKATIPHAAEPCISFWWREVMQLTPIFRGISSVHVHHGDTNLF